MPDHSKDSHRPLKVTITAVAALALAVRVLFPALRIDAVSLGLLTVGLLPWLAPLIRSVELPGGLKIELQDVKKAAERITAGEPVVPVSPRQEPAYAFLAVAEQSPALALVGLRIEIEKRLRALAELVGIPKSRPLTQLASDLRNRNVLNAKSAEGLLDLVSLGNRAAHGVDVTAEAASWSVEAGPQILALLDAKIASMGGSPRS